MSHPRRCLNGIALTLACASAPALACGQGFRPDAEAYPCGSVPKLTIRQQDQGFAITKLDPAVLARISPAFRTPTEIAIGAALRIDRSIFMTNLLQAAGGSDARR